MILLQTVPRSIDLEKLEEELITDSDLGINLASNRELQNKFRVSAEEWLGTWRVTE